MRFGHDQFLIYCYRILSRPPTGRLGSQTSFQVFFGQHITVCPVDCLWMLSLGHQLLRKTIHITYIKQAHLESPARAQRFPISASLCFDGNSVLSNFGQWDVTSYIPWAFPPTVVSSYVMFSFLHRRLYVKLDEIDKLYMFYFMSHEAAFESYRYS